MREGSGAKRFSETVGELGDMVAKCKVPRKGTNDVNNLSLKQSVFERVCLQGIAMLSTSSEGTN